MGLSNVLKVADGERWKRSTRPTKANGGPLRYVFYNPNL